MDHEARPFEENLSAMMDGELSGEELLDSIDALVEDGELREFWRDARQLQKGLRQPQTGLVEVPPAHVWENVERVVRSGGAKIFPLRRVSPQVWVAAASVVLIFSLTLAGLFRGALPMEANARTVHLGANDGKMTEERFLELTSEILQADPRYHRKMLEVMETVNREVYKSRAGLRSEEGGPGTKEKDGRDLAAGLTSDVNRSTSEPPVESPGRSTNSGGDSPVRINLW